MEVQRKKNEKVDLIAPKTSSFNQIQKEKEPTGNAGSSKFFSSQLSGLISGLSTVRRTEFAKTFDFGSPVEDKSANVLFIHHRPKTLPKSSAFTDSTVSTGQGNLQVGIEHLTPEEASKNCEMMYVMTIPNNYDNACTAIIPNYENYHVQKWMRQGNNGGAMNPNSPLKYVNRGMVPSKGNRSFRTPSVEQIRKHWEMLERYFENFDDVVAELRPIAEKVARDNTIIVLTCNMGQSELLMNFVCNAKLRVWTLIISWYSLQMLKRRSLRKVWV